MSTSLSLTVHRPLSSARPVVSGREGEPQRRVVKEFVSTLAVAAGTAPRAHPGLAPWQIRQLRLHLHSNLGSKITTHGLADIVRLSPSHFSRAFTVSFGNSPHRYLLQRRMERSQDLMLTTTAAIADIALDCGLVDQAHFGRLFRRLIGESPAAWRRARRSM
jgi:AraC family transcriptional regulator